MREELIWFAEIMEKKLSKNDHKTSWKICEDSYLFSKLIGEIAELSYAVMQNDKQGVIDECSDVANFAMMIADNFNK